MDVFQENAFKTIVCKLSTSLGLSVLNELLRFLEPHIHPWTTWSLASNVPDINHTCGSLESNLSSTGRTNIPWDNMQGYHCGWIAILFCEKSNSWYSGLVVYKDSVLPHRKPIAEIIWSYERLISTTGFSLRVRQSRCIDSGHRSISNGFPRLQNRAVITWSIFSKISQKTPHSSPLRERYEVFFCGFSLCVILCLSLQWCMQYLVILDCVITELDCICYLNTISSFRHYWKWSTKSRNINNFPLKNGFSKCHLHHAAHYVSSFQLVTLHCKLVLVFSARTLSPADDKLPQLQ